MANRLQFVLCLFISIIFLQSLYFKLTLHAETIYIFVTVGTWLKQLWFVKYGAFITGFIELIATILLFTKQRFYGAFLAMVMMLASLTFYLFGPVGIKLPVFDDQTGYQVGDDGGLLFIITCTILIFSFILLIVNSNKAKNLLGLQNKLNS